MEEVTFYKFNEDHYLDIVKSYIENTYEQHYSDGGRQAVEDIMDAGLARGFLMGNIIKYASRLGKKGTLPDWEKDLYKIIHYAVLALYDIENECYEWPQSRSKDQEQCDKNWKKWAEDNPQYFKDKEPLFYESNMGWVYDDE